MSPRILPLFAPFALLAAACSDDSPVVPAGPCSAGHAPIGITLHTELRGQYLDDTPGNATWVAVQDGHCDWQPITGDAGEYSFAVTDDRYAVAVVCADPSRPELASTHIYFRHIDDPRQLRSACAAVLPDEPAARLGFTSEGSSPYAVQLHVLDGVTDYFEGGPGGILTVSMAARTGLYDIAVLGRDDGAASRLMIRRDAPAIGDQLVAAGVNDILTWPELGPDATAQLEEPALAIYADYLTSRGTIIGELPDSSPDVDALVTINYATVPAALVAPGDAYRLRTTHWDGGPESLALHYRYTEHYLAAAPEQVLAAPAPLGAIGVEVIREGEQAGQVAFTVDALDGAHLYTVSQQVEYPTVTTLSVWSYSSAWLGDDVQYRIELASLLDAPGFDPAWVARDGRNGQWEARVFGNSEGWDGEELAAELGTREGVPAEMVGMTRWMARALLDAPQ